MWNYHNIPGNISGEAELNFNNTVLREVNFELNTGADFDPSDNMLFYIAHPLKVGHICSRLRPLPEDNTEKTLRQILDYFGNTHTHFWKKGDGCPFESFLVGTTCLPKGVALGSEGSVRCTSSA